MKKIYETLPWYKDRTKLTDWDGYKNLAKVKDGKLARRLLRLCDAGMTNEDFDKLAKTEDFQRAVDALLTEFGGNDREGETRLLRTTALEQFLLKKLDGTIPWAAYAARRTCLMKPIDDFLACEHKSNCVRILSRFCHSPVESILIRHDLLTLDGGIFAERIISAIELGVPLERIKGTLDINFDAGMKALKKYIPDITEATLAKCADEYQRSWKKRERQPTASSSSYSPKP